MNPRHLLRMSRWARNPPSEKRVKLVFGIVALALLIGGIEWMGWWPEWATAERIPRKF
tara:strand:- start:325 stop:498 length:174 start_codon:yes stop_codon:yes gene_type:complete